MDKSGLLGKFKTWIYQHGILPQILWPLLVYEVLISIVEWLGLPQSLSSIILYRQNNKQKLPISNLYEEFKVTCTREVLQY